MSPPAAVATVDDHSVQATAGYHPASASGLFAIAATKPGQGRLRPEQAGGTATQKGQVQLGTIALAGSGDGLDLIGHLRRRQDVSAPPDHHSNQHGCCWSPPQPGPVGVASCGEEDKTPRWLSFVLKMSVDLIATVP